MRPLLRSGMALTLALKLALAAVAAFPVNRCLIAGGRGHAVVHTHHRH
jgi:hypothetical protein